MGWRKRRNRTYNGWAPYVPVGERRKQAARKVALMNKNGEKVSPVAIRGRTIATTFWGKAWCKNLESYMDYANRLPRGRTYVRNGSIVDLKITPGKIKAMVSGSSLYTVEISIKPVEEKRWRGVIKDCSGKIASLVELLQGKLSKSVMESVTSQTSGLFPSPQQISLRCSCPDWATMCKHVAAVMYGVGHRLDHKPELLFLLRQVNHLDLIAKASVTSAIGKAAKGKVLETTDLGTMFGIEIEDGPSASSRRKVLPNKKASKKSSKMKVKKVTARKKKVLPTKKKKKKKTKAKAKRVKAKKAKTKKSFIA